MILIPSPVLLDEIIEVLCQFAPLLQLGWIVLLPARAVKNARSRVGLVPGPARRLEQPLDPGARFRIVLQPILHLFQKIGIVILFHRSPPVRLEGAYPP
jgi:hypothetical protein